jgi:F-type H+-transporting ATPase subunit alpha
VGISVSRVGGAAQLASMKQVAGTLRLDLASYREKQAFSQFGSDLDEATQYQLNHGAHMMELLKQKRYAAIDVADQVIAIFAAKENFMDDLDLAQVLPFREELSAYMVQEHPQIRDVVRMGKMSDETQAELKRYVGEFKERYVRDHGLLEEESSEEKTVPGFTD